jgi:hypothetical protein
MKYTKYLIIILLVLLFNGCSTKTSFIEDQEVIFKSNKFEDKIHQQRIYSYKKEFSEKNKDIRFDVYNIAFPRIKPYLEGFDSYGNKRYSIIGLSPEISWLRLQGFVKRENYKDSYTCMIFTLNQEPLNKNMLPYFNTLNTSYEAKLSPKTINQFVEYPCDKHIVFSEYERDGSYRPLKATCYAKRLDKDVFLITRFAHPNTQEDKKLFQTEIIPTMLKNIKVTPKKLSPWEYY